MVPWYEAGDLAPVEHLSDDFQNIIRPVGMLYAELRVDGLDVRGDEAHRQPPRELREDVAIQVGPILLPGLLLLLRMTLDVRLDEFVDRLQLPLRFDVALRVLLVRSFGEVGHRLLAGLVEADRVGAAEPG